MENYQKHSLSGTANLGNLLLFMKNIFKYVQYFEFNIERNINIDHRMARIKIYAGTSKLLKIYCCMYLYLTIVQFD